MTTVCALVLLGSVCLQYVSAQAVGVCVHTLYASKCGSMGMQATLQVCVCLQYVSCVCLCAC